MSRLKPGSIAWLLAYEWRLSWRVPKAMRGRRNVALIVGGLALLLGGVPMGLLLANRLRGVSTAAIVGVDAAFLLFLTLMINVSLLQATRAFYERADLDLLLSSPLPGRKVLAVRAANIAGQAFLTPAGLASPFLAPVILFGHWAWLGFYPVMAAMGLLAASAGIGLAMTLFRLIGPRAAKTVGQVLSSLTGAAVFLASQAVRLIPHAGRLLSRALDSAARAGWFAPLSPLSWPGRAAFGQPLPLLGLTALSLAVFAATVHVLGERFVANAAVGAGLSAPAARRAGRGGAADFTGSVFTTLVRKEWRLLLRDPQLMSQLLVRLLYLAPMVFVLLGQVMRHSALAALAAAPVALMAGQIAGSLAWITLSAEDAPDLLAASPIGGPVARRAKLAAALQPVAALFALPVLALLFYSPRIALAAAVGAALAAVSAALVNLWLEKPAPRQSFFRRPGASGAIFAELGTSVGWATATGLAAAGSNWALVPAVFALMILGAVKALAEPDRVY